jgi:hypothetical protein
MSSEVEPVEVEAPKPRVPEPEPLVAPEPPARHSGGALFDTGMGAGMGAPTVPTLLRQLSRRPPEDRKSGIDDLNDRVGNRRVARMIALDGPRLARRELGDEPDSEPVDPAVAAANNADLLAKAIKSKDLADIKAVSDFSSATGAERTEFITIILDQGWVGPADEAALERLWNSFGEGIVDMVNNSSDLWDLCVDRGMDPSNIAAVAPLRKKFEDDVKALAKGYMAQNLEYANEQMTRLGVNGAASESPTAEMEQSIAMEEVQELARGAEELLAAKDKMRHLQVGWDQDQSVRESLNETPNYFDPEKKPVLTSGGPDSQKAPYDWAVVKEQWDAATAAVAGIAAQNPTVFAAIAQGRSEVKALGEGDPKAAKATASKVLAELKKNIEATIPKVDTGDLDWRDLKPIHQQLFGGRKAPSGTEWNSQLPKSIANDVVGDHESTEFWISLGIGTAAAALFIVASIATGGLATAALLGGLAASGGQAAASWENYEDLATAAAGTASEETKLISEGQVDAALVQAVLDTIFAVLDFGQARGIYRGIQAGKVLAEALAKNSAEAVLEAGMKEGWEAAGKAIERSVAELGAEATARRTGKTAEQLAGMLPADSPMRARLLASKDLIDRAAKEGMQDAAALEARAAVTVGSNAAEAWKAGRPLSELLSDIPAAIKAGLDRTFIDNLVIEGIESMGAANVLKKMGGWREASQLLTDKSAAGKLFMDWRSAVFADLEGYVVNTLKGEVQRTGTASKFSNDIDMSFIGKNASEARDGAAAYLAKRLGVGNSPKEFDRIMMAGLFTDPRRMHAYDGLPDVIRESIARTQASKQESLIWNRRLWEAAQDGDEALVAHVKAEMGAMGIAEFSYKPLTSSDISRLSKRVDGLHAELEAAVKAGDTAAQQRLATEIGDAQALINASEAGGYFSGGGVRRYVSERPKEKQFPRLDGEKNPAGLIQVEKVTAIVDQLPKLDHSLLQLGGSAEDVVAGIRGIGKYGGRLLEVAGETGGDFASKFKVLADECAALKEAADAAGRTMGSAEANALSTRARAAMSELTAKSSEILSTVRQGAQMENVGDIMGAIQNMTIAHTRLLRSTEWTLKHINKMVRAIEQGRRLADMDEGMRPPGEPAPNASMPEPNQSVEPPSSTPAQ